MGWIYAGIQVMNPGETATAHRHSASAIRFIMEGTGAYTVVDGHKMTLGANDFVLTPNGTWHEHGVREGRFSVFGLRDVRYAVFAIFDADGDYEFFDDWEEHNTGQSTPPTLEVVGGSTEEADVAIVVRDL